MKKLILAIALLVATPAIAQHMMHDGEPPESPSIGPPPPRGVLLVIIHNGGPRPPELVRIDGTAFKTMAECAVVSRQITAEWISKLSYKVGATCIQ